MIPAELRKVKPMLADSGRWLAATPQQAVDALFGDDSGWVADMKWDGVRALAFVDGGKACLINRNLTDTSHRYPEVIAALEERFADEDVVLDGELLCFDDEGKPSWDRTHRRDAQSNPKAIAQLAAQTPARLVTFDVLFRKGEDLRRRPYEARLGALLGYGLQDGALRQSVITRDGQLLWNHVQEHKLEGIIAKKLDAPYRSGRRDRAWTKIKATKRASFLVTGYEPGKGARAGRIGSLKLGLIDASGAIVQRDWRAGSGLNDLELDDMLNRIESGTPTVVEIEYLNVTTDGALRMPIFMGVRTDIDILDCTLEQLERG